MYSYGVCFKNSKFNIQYIIIKWLPHYPIFSFNHIYLKWFKNLNDASIFTLKMSMVPYWRSNIKF